jgi:4-hydroxy-2-oxoheptanedioate aldolase
MSERSELHQHGGLKARWAAGATTFGGWCSIPSSVSAEFMAAEGFDYVGVDCQHGLTGPDTLVPMLQAIGRYDAPAVVRVPVKSGWWIQRALDCGAEAVIVPMVNSAEEAAEAASHCRYAPLGQRSFGPIRSELVIGADAAAANERVACLVMIETVAGVQAVDAICATPGVEGVYVGPADLAISFGLSPRLAPIPGAHADAMDRVVAACAARGIVPGVHSGSGEHARSFAERGFRMITVASDLASLRSYARAQLRTARGTDDDRRSGG